ncbi:probable C-mannosyltransferase DPY19L1 isoform X2 [Cephus cinctus]|nr:probable C-mannosyltransferase DPY19L1 isoform X2 [Cephus cinctus]
MSFRTEMGMYYSYYKTISESKNFMEGFSRITRDNLTEYPNVIDASKKYNLYPEIIIGHLYHVAKTLGLLSKQQCWQIERGDNLPPVTSCEGLAVPVYFYLEIVWYCAACTGAILFLYGCRLSDSVYGGTIAILCFFYNHNECTRVQWTPPLRESFAYPALLFQMYSVTVAIKDYRTGQTTIKHPCRDKIYLRIFIGTLLSLLTWQFSQFVFTTQIIALLILKWLMILPKELYSNIILMHMLPLVIVAIITQNVFLVCSLYACLLICNDISAFLLSKVSRFLDQSKLSVLEMIGTVVLTRLLKFYLLDSMDDAHVFNILRSKLTGYKDFHTLLYTCSVEFDFLQYDTYEIIVKTLLLPSAILAGFLIVYSWYRNYRINKNYLKWVEADVAYNALQTGAFILMAVFIMRLKLFMTPHLCLFAGTVSSKKYLEKVGLRSEKIRGALVFLLLAGMAYHGVKNLQKERGFIGEYSNVEQEELFEWIKENTPRTAAFAGKMSLMANLMLSTGRPIVNNPYYEDKEMRERTINVYQIFGRNDLASVYDILKTMQVDYVVLEEVLCFGLGKVKEGCRMVDLWDVNDNGRQKQAGKSSICPILFRGSAHPFRRVFVNRSFAVLRLDYSKYVELKPRVIKYYKS